MTPAETTAMAVPSQRAARSGRREVTSSMPICERVRIPSGIARKIEATKARRETSSAQPIEFFST